MLLQVANVRGFYQNVIPSTVVCLLAKACLQPQTRRDQRSCQSALQISEVAPPDCHIFKFTTCGRYLVCDMCSS